MKELLSGLLTFALIIFCVVKCAGACGDSNTDSVKYGDIVYTEECFGAYTKEAFKKLNDYAAKRDVYAVSCMLANHELVELRRGTKGEAIEFAFGMTKIRLFNGSEVWCSKEFVKK